jgi:hypothetical protein
MEWPSPELYGGNCGVVVCGFSQPVSLPEHGRFQSENCGSRCPSLQGGQFALQRLLDSLSGDRTKHSCARLIRSPLPALVAFESRIRHSRSDPRRISPSELAWVCRSPSEQPQVGVGNPENDAHDTLMDLYGSTPLLKRENRQYWGVS